MKLTHPIFPFLKIFNESEKDIIPEKIILKNNFSKDIITYGESVIASPSVRKFARELGCDLKKVYGSGQKGRISKEDVEKYVKNILNNNVFSKKINTKNTRMKDWKKVCNWNDHSSKV